MEMQTEQVWREAIARGDLGVWDLRPQLETVHYSPQWKARLGFPNLHEADSTDFWRCRVHPDDLGAMLDALRAHTEGRSRTYESKFRLRSNGSGYRLLHSRGRVVERDGQGRVLRMVGTMVDLSESLPSPRGGMVNGARSGIALPPMDRPFHALLGAAEQPTTAATRAISTPLADVRERLLVLVRDLLDTSIGQLQQIEIAQR